MVANVFDVSNKVAIITGGSRGLGRAMSMAFADAGAKVVIASRKQAACDQLVAEIRAAGGDALAVACHVGEWSGLESLVQAAKEHYGRLDILINNAGMSPVAPSMLETSEAHLDKIVDVNPEVVS